jgi:SOS-response transcriptional repressor LexA
LGESQIYRDLMRFKPEGLSPNAWAVKAGVSRTVWNDMRRHGNPSRRTLEKLLAAAGSSLAEFEALRIGPEPRPPSSSFAQVGDVRRGWNPAPLPPLPLIASTLAGEWGQAGSKIEMFEIRPGELLDRLPRPATLAADPEAFAITIVGDSMWPRFRPGARAAVAPRLPVAVGDDVLVRLRAGENVRSDANERVLIMHLVKRTQSGFELMQFNPELTVHVDAADVEAILKIPGELI